ncbi:hypothetical protein [Faecalibacillus faecis]|uniref:hypothetical protein n=1 Tax=Faecalibacillus faecis TaxID=1982628 RepID=UPI00386F9CA4
MEQIIWSNTNLTLSEEWRDFYKEERPDIYNAGEDAMYEQMILDKDEFLQDEIYNCDKLLEGRILVIADLGLWNGRRSGYKILVNNLNEIFKTRLGDYYKIYCDGYNVKMEDYHHDGVNYYMFREIKEDRNIDKLLDAIYNGKTISSAMLNYYTKSLRSYIWDIYGKPSR